MSSDTVGFVGSIPEHYDKGLGPTIFVEPAADLAARVAALNPARVLETAAGTGIVTRALRDALPAACVLVSTDISPPMLEVARAKVHPGEQVEFRQADATALGFADASFDAVACQFGVMFFPDKPLGYREALRVLKPGGRYLFNVWDSHRYNPFGRISHDIVEQFFPIDPPQFQRIPFGYCQIDLIKESLLAAGFSGIDIAIVTYEKEVGDSSQLARGIVYGSPLIDQIRNRGGVEPERVLDALKEAFQAEFGSSPGRMPLQLIVFSARRPS